MKKTIAIMLATVLCFGVVACGKSQTNEGDVESGASNADVALTTVVDAIKDAYGEEYLPNMLVEGEMLETTYGLTSDLYEEVYVEVPMISANIDTLIAVKVAEGKQADVVAALTKYRDYLLNDALQYPMNQLKLQSSRIIEKNGFVFFVSLGAIPMDVEGDEAIIKKAAELNDIAEEAINSVLK